MMNIVIAFFIIFFCQGWAQRRTAVRLYGFTVNAADGGHAGGVPLHVKFNLVAGISYLLPIVQKGM